jgi:hypothetical protein
MASRVGNRLDRVLRAGSIGPIVAPRFLWRWGARRRLGADGLSGRPRIDAATLDQRARRWRTIAEEARLGGGVGVDIAIFVGLGPVGLFAAGATLAFILAPWAIADLLPPMLISQGIVALSAWLYASRRAARRTVTWWETDRCADCGYDLAGLDSIDGAGPERCPECGAPWPFIPPYIPIDQQRPGA